MHSFQYRIRHQDTLRNTLLQRIPRFSFQQRLLLGLEVFIGDLLGGCCGVLDHVHRHERGRLTILCGFWGAEEADLELELFETVVEVENLALQFGELELSEAVFWGVRVCDF